MLRLFSRRPKYQAATPGTKSRRPWHPGVGRRFPYTGIFSLIGVIIFAVAAAIVLAVSDGQPIDRWKINQTNVQPTVLLAIFSAFANALLRIAFSEGHVIAWWQKALRGDSIAMLQGCWAFGQGFIQGLYTKAHIGFIAFASFSVMIILIDGPLLQRASTVGTILRIEPLQLSVPVSPGPFAQGATGVFAPHDFSWWPTLYNDDFAEGPFCAHRALSAIADLL